MKELSEVWNDLSDISQANILEMIGGKRNANTVTALLTNFDTAESVIETAANSAGSALEENEKYLDSINGKISQLQASFEKLSSVVIDSGLVKGILDIGKSGLEGLTKLIENNGEFSTLLTTLAGIMSIYTGAGSHGNGLGILGTYDGNVIFDPTGVGKIIRLYNEFSESTDGLSDAQAGLIRQYEFAYPKVTKYLTKIDGSKASFKGMSKWAKESGESVDRFGIKAKAAAVGATVLNTALNVLTTWAVSSLIQAGVSKLNDLIFAKEHAIEQAEERAEKSKEEAKAAREEMSTIGELADQYRELRSGDITNTDTREKILSIQKEITKLVGQEARGLDLVSDGLEDNLEKFQNLQREAAKRALEASNAAYIETKNAAIQDNDFLGENVIRVKLENEEDIESAQNVIDALAEYGYKVGYVSSNAYIQQTDVFGNKELVMDARIDKYGGPTTDVEKRAAAMQVWMDILESAGLSAEKAFSAIHSKWNDFNTIIENDENGTKQILEDAFSFESTSDALRNITVDSAEAYEKYRSAMIEALSNNFSVKSWIETGDITDADIESYVDSMMRSLYSEFTNAIQELKAGLSFSQLFTDDDGEDSFQSKVDTYVGKVQELKGVLDQFKEEDFNLNDYIKSEEFIELVEKYPELAKHVDNLSEAIADQIKELTGYSGVVDDTGKTVVEATGIMAAFDKAFGQIDSEDDRRALQLFMDTVLELGNVVGNTSFSIDIEAETNGMTDFWNAMKESVSSTGLALDTINKLKERYKDLAGYDPSVLFEKTANGIHLNIDAVKELERAYQAQTKTEIDTHLADLIDQYDELTDQINNAGAAMSTSDLYKQRDDIARQIDETAILAAQYRGLTSAIYAWEQAQSTPNEGDMYDSVVSGLDKFKELFENGLIGTDDFETYLQLWTDQDVAIMSSKEKVDEYYKALERAERYGTENADGALNFLHDLQKANSDWVKLGEDGYWDINLGPEGDEAAAKALGISVDALQAILRKLPDYGLTLKLETDYSDIDLAKTKAEEAAETLKELGKSKYEFNFNTDSIEEADKQVKEAKSIYESFLNENGELDLSVAGAAEAKVLLESMLSIKHSLEAPTIMQFDVTQLQGVDESVIEAITQIQILSGLFDQLDTQRTLGLDTTETLQQIQVVAAAINALPSEVKVAFGLDTEETSNALTNLEKGEYDAEMNLTVSEESINTVKTAFSGIKIEELDNASIMKKLEETEDFVIHDKEFRVTANGLTQVLSLLRQTNSLQLNDKSYTITEKRVTVNNQSKEITDAGKSSLLPSKPSSSLLPDKVFAEGSSGTKDSGEALFGEEGMEIISREGQFYTVGEDSAEFAKYKKGDIIFNAEQTEQLLKDGKITTGKKRGKAFASGTKKWGNKDGSQSGGQFWVNGQVVTEPTGNGNNKGNGNGNGNDDEEDNSTIIDWIEIAIDRIERAINRLATIATSQFRKLTERLGATNDELSEMAYELKIQQAGYQRYLQQANSVGLSADLAERVRNGAIDINEYEGETAEQIQDYQQWYRYMPSRPETDWRFLLNCRDTLKTAELQRRR